MLSLAPSPEPDQTADDDSGQSGRDRLYQGIIRDIRERNSWENKYVDHYRMRHNGIRRKQKPWANAADLHWPLIDTNIEKLKPLFFQQIVGMDIVATFVPMRQQLDGMSTSAAGWFDYKMREKSNLQDEALSWIDYTLMSGRGTMKVTWNERKKQVEFTAIDPLYIIVPQHTKELQDADRIVHVMPMSVEAYKRDGRYKTDAETLKKLKTSSDDHTDPGKTSLAASRRLREGLTHSASSETIIVWEVYERQDDGTWIMHTFSPADTDNDLRDPMQLPYEHGMAPFVDFAYEIKDKGWYSPRGIAEILSPYEAALCHTWNQKHDSMQLFNKPVFRAEREVPNTMNLRMQPGQILPYGIAPVTMPQPPMSFDQEMTSVRSIAEARVSNPDYGMGQVIETQNRRTATEISAIGAQTQQAGDLRARVFRTKLGRLYKMAWALLCQFDAEDLKYRLMDDAVQVDAQALHGDYHIEPKGGVNEVNRSMLLQRAVSRKQLFAGAPHINQPELDKSILELDDPSLVKRVFIDPNLPMQNEVADEMKGIPALLLGAPLPITAGMNYTARIGVLMQFLKQMVTLGQLQALPPQGRTNIVTRLQGLLAEDAKVDNNGAKSLARDVADFLTHIGLLAADAPGGAGAQPSMPPPPAPAQAIAQPPLPQQAPAGAQAQPPAPPQGMALGGMQPGQPGSL